MHVLHVNITTPAASTTTSPYSAKTKEVPHTVAPTLATYYLPPSNSSNDQLPFYTAPTASAPFGSTGSGPCKNVGSVQQSLDDDYVILCPIDPSFLVPAPPTAPYVQQPSGSNVYIDSYFLRDDMKKCFHRFYFNHLSTKAKFQECVYPTNDL